MYKEANKILDEEIKEIYKNSKNRYGAPKITFLLKKKGIKACQNRVSKRMKLLGIRSIINRKFRPHNSKSPNINKDYPNLLNQEFTADKPGLKCVSDITYIYTKEQGWTYLAVIIDLFDLKVIGWTYGKKIDTYLVITALSRAVINRDRENDCILHSDRGSQYTSIRLEEMLEILNIKHSYSKKGYPYDNASMESFNAILKKEEVNLSSYDNLENTKLILFNFIESWYNNTRIHSKIDYMTPNEKYNNYLLSLA